MCETAVGYRSACRCIPKNKTVDSDNPKLNVLLLHSARAHRKSVNAASPVAFMAFIAWHECRGRVRTQQTADWRKNMEFSVSPAVWSLNTNILDPGCPVFVVWLGTWSVRIPFNDTETWISELPLVERLWSISSLQGLLKGIPHFSATPYALHRKNSSILKSSSNN